MNFRMKRLHNQFLREITQIIRFEIKDPRVLGAFISLSDINITKDLSLADIYVSIFMGDKLKVLEGLNHSSGFIRSLLGKRLYLRKVPKMVFHLDYSLERGAEIIQKLDHLKEIENE